MTTNNRIKYTSIPGASPFTVLPDGTRINIGGAFPHDMVEMATRYGLPVTGDPGFLKESFLTMVKNGGRPDAVNAYFSLADDERGGERLLDPRPSDGDNNTGFGQIDRAGLSPYRPPSFTPQRVTLGASGGGEAPTGGGGLGAFGTSGGGSGLGAFATKTADAPAARAGERLGAFRSPPAPKAVSAPNYDWDNQIPDYPDPASALTKANESLMPKSSDSNLRRTFLSGPYSAIGSGIGALGDAANGAADSISAQAERLSRWLNAPADADTYVVKSPRQALGNDGLNTLIDGIYGPPPSAANPTPPAAAQSPTAISSTAAPVQPPKYVPTRPAPRSISLASDESAPPAQPVAQRQPSSPPSSFTPMSLEPPGSGIDRLLAGGADSKRMLLQTGLGMMAAGKPGATLFSSLGEGGLSALTADQANEDRKAKRVDTLADRQYKDRELAMKGREADARVAEAQNLARYRDAQIGQGNARWIRRRRKPSCGPIPPWLRSSIRSTAPARRRRCSANRARKLPRRARVDRPRGPRRRRPRRCRGQRDQVMMESGMSRIRVSRAGGALSRDYEQGQLRTRALLTETTPHHPACSGFAFRNLRTAPATASTGLSLGMQNAFGFADSSFMYTIP